ncbi:MAG: hypothetical protein K9K37_08420 [Desulfocapsa sp.]|nr:hypothetical protein [Desulfocapsa sp.]
MGFTFYGDLLGISGYYKLSPSIAKDKLNEFYNTVFFSLSDYCRDNVNAHVHMFSDSLLFYGDDPTPAIVELHRVYIKLLHKGLLLRGAMVTGRINFQIRTELINFEKQLPNDDTLARAVGLESTKKGARFLIEPELANVILEGHQEWLTHEGYVNKQTGHPYGQVPYESTLRRIAPTPEQDVYEFLYFWACHRHLNHNDVDYDFKIETLEEIKGMLGQNIAIHYKGTIDLLRRCNKRQKFTRKMLNM